MITYHILEYLRLAGYGTAIDTDLFFEKLPIGKTGVAIYSVGGERPRGGRSKSQMFELECRGESDTIGRDKLDKIATSLADDWIVCDLPTIPGISNRLYKRCYFTDVSDIQNVGFDANDRIIFKITARIVYQK